MDDDVSSDVAVLSTQHYIEDGDIKYNLSNFVYSSLGYWSETELSYSTELFFCNLHLLMVWPAHTLFSSE
jgi:hypothetical protein